ncbi:MAG: hypothetical protein ACLQPH_21260 [Acidimicrobiales bacterium]
MSATDERTRALTAAASASVGDGGRARLRDRLVAGLPPVVERLPAGHQVVVTLSLLRRAQADPESLGTPDEPFAWKPAFVRRSLGLAVVDACATGRYRSPAEAVGPVVADAVAEWRRSGWRTFHWEPWFAGLAAGARAVVEADALTWATSVWSSFDWRALGRAPRIGGADDQWVCPAARTLRLKGRTELRIPVAGAGSGPRPGIPQTALVSVSGGAPAQGWDEELAFLALVAGLRSPSRPVPTRAMGLWPDAGAHRTVEVDERALGAAVRRVEATLAAVVEARLATTMP